MKFDKETIVVILIAAAILIAWFIFYPKYQKERAAEAARAQLEFETAQNSSVPAQNAPPSIPSTPSISPAAVPATPATPAATSTAVAAPAANVAPLAVSGEKSFTLANDKLSVLVDVASSGLESISLVNYKNAKNREITVAGGSDGLRKSLQPSMGDATLISAAGERLSPNAVRITSDWSNGLRLTQQITLPESGYLLESQYTLTNPKAETVSVPEFTVWSAGVPPTKFFSGDIIYSERHNIDFHVTGSNSVVTADPAVKKDAKFQSFGTTQAVDWAGSTNKFFASILFQDHVSSGIPNGTKFTRTYRQDPEKPTEKYVIPSVGITLKDVSVPGNQTVTVNSVKYYFGPKEIAEVGKLPSSVMEAMHISYFSWFEFLARPMVRFLVYLHSLCHSYGLAIIILTLLVRLVFWPITQKANNSMRKMQKLKPKMDEIRAKYKDNPQEMNARMMELYRTEKVSPLGGCLPILLQIPVFFALYSALDSAVELRQVSFLWCTDLAKPDLVGPQITLPFLGPTGLHPLVIAMTILMVIQQKMTPSNMDPMQQKMMMFMPIVMLFMLYNLPSGLTLYWTVSNIFSILQMKYGLIVAKREEEKEASAPKINKSHA